jgi:hypothetical protein
VEKGGGRKYREEEKERDEGKARWGKRGREKQREEKKEAVVKSRD